MNIDSDFGEFDPARIPLGSISDLPVPLEFYRLAEELPALDSEALEVQLQKFDLFLTTANSQQRKTISQILITASSKTIPSKVRLRIIKAGKAVASGGNTIST